MNRRKSYLKLAPYLIAAMCLISCQKDEYHTISGYAQGGLYSISCSCSAKDIPSLKAGVDSILNEIDNAVSGYNKSSVLSRLNSGEEVSRETEKVTCGIYDELIAYSDSMRVETGGAFDVRMGALFNLWGFGFKTMDFPDEEDIKDALSDTSQINFNAVAQGYSCDKVAQYLKARGVRNMLLNIGGEIYCLGVNSKGKGWTIGIDRPVDGNNIAGKDLQTAFALPCPADCAVVTSGNYRKFYVRDGVKYSHTIDPRSGRPVSHNLLSATVIAPDAALADVLATYCMVIGMEDASRFIESDSRLEGCLISSDSLWTSEGFNPVR